MFYFASCVEVEGPAALILTISENLANLNIINLVLVRSRHRSKLLNDHFCYLRFDVSFAFDINYLLYLLVIVCACQSKKAFILLLHSKFPIDINYSISQFLHRTLY